MVKNPLANVGDLKRLGFDSWVGKTPWRRAQHPTPVFVPGESLGKEPGGPRSTGSQSVGQTAVT